MMQMRGGDGTNAGQGMVPERTLSGDLITCLPTLSSRRTVTNECAAFFFCCFFFAFFSAWKEEEEVWIGWVGWSSARRVQGASVLMVDGCVHGWCQRVQLTCTICVLYRTFFFRSAVGLRTSKAGGNGPPPSPSDHAVTLTSAILPSDEP